MKHRDTAQSVFFAPFDSCPGCSARGPLPQAAGDQAIFYCPTCRSYWHVGLAWMHRVDPAMRPSRAPAGSSALPGSADPGGVATKGPVPNRGAGRGLNTGNV
jgi:hypothetical protein